LQLSVIIVNYNVRYFLEQCLASVLKACNNITAEILVVDNNSSDGSEEYLTSRFPTVRFSWNAHNDGFGKASNSMIPIATGDHVLFLNPDTIVPEDCFTSCLQFFKQHQDCGALGVHMIDGSGRFLKESKRSDPSARASFYKITGLSAMFPKSRLFAEYYAGSIPEHVVSPVDVLAGAFMMLDKKILQATGGFDERFFMYAEDIDLSYRLRKEGKKNYYFPGTTIIHFKGESTQRLSPVYNHHFYSAMQLFVDKHYKGNGPLYYLTSTAISLNKLMAKGKSFLQKKFSKPASTAALNTVVIATQKNFNELIHLIKYSSRPVVISGRIAPAENDRDNSIATLPDLASVLQNKDVQQAIFCAADISYKKIISLIQELPSTAAFLFHAANSDSIVGSSRKDNNGIVISRETITARGQNP